MRLSEAILLGDVLRRREPFVFLSEGGECGCALGGAYLAAGHDVSNGANVPEILAAWPWLTPDNVSAIGRRFFEVCWGKKSLEQLADYVRSIEPPDAPELQGRTRQEPCAATMTDKLLQK